MSEYGPFLLKSVTIRNLRSLVDVGPVSIQPNLTVATGQNDGGKSTFISAVGFLLGANSVDRRDRTKDAAEHDHIEVCGTFSTIESNGDHLLMHVRATQDESGKRKLEVEDGVHPAFGLRPSDLTVVDLRACMKTAGIKAPAGAGKSKLVLAAETWIRAQPGSDLVYAWRPITDTERRMLPTFTGFTSREAANPSATLQTMVQRTAHELLKDTDGIGAPLADVSKKLNDAMSPHMADIKAKIKEYCSDIEEVTVEANFDFRRPSLRVELGIGTSDNPVDVDRSGDGKQRRIALAIHEAELQVLRKEQTNPSTAILAYDEPDTHLDYASQRRLFEILELQSELPHVQVIVATHSMNFIDRAPFESLLHFQLDIEHRTRVHDLNPGQLDSELSFRASIADSLGLRNSVLLDGQCFLIVEGETEEAAIPLLFKLVKGKSLPSCGITLINVKGVTNAAAMAGMLKTELGRHVVLLLDGDAQEPGGPIATGKFKGMKMNQFGRVFFLGTREFEDAFKDSLWLRTVQSQFPHTNGYKELTLDDFANLRATAKKFSKSLEDMISERHGCNLDKVELGRALSMSCEDQTDVPEELIVCFDHIYNASHGVGF